MSTRRKPQSRNPAGRPGGAAQRGTGADGRGSASPAGSATDEESREPGGTGAADGASKVAAVGLWAVVGGGLVYGVWQTLVKVVALFTG